MAFAWKINAKRFLKLAHSGNSNTHLTQLESQAKKGRPIIHQSSLFSNTLF